MKKRLKSLTALIMICIFCLQTVPLDVSALNISGDYTLTEDSDTDGYVVTSGGILRFAENLVVNNPVSFELLSNMQKQLVIPASAVMNGTITMETQYASIENAGTITSALDLQAGRLNNSGTVSKISVNNQGILQAGAGSSYGELDISEAGSGAFILMGEISCGTLYMNSHAFSELDSNGTQIRVTDKLVFSETTASDVVKLHVNDATKITTSGISGLSVWKDGIKYPLPATAISNKTLGSIYSVGIEKSALSFNQKTIGYQTTEAKTFVVTNNGLADVKLKVVPKNEWDTMLKVTAGGSTVNSSSQFTLAAGESLTFNAELKKGLSAGTHNGVLTLQYCTGDGTAYASKDITGKITVKKAASLAAPTGKFYALSGTEGKNGFYTSNVKVLPKSGYSIAKSLSDDFTSTVTYTKSAGKPTVYLQKNSTGQITEKAALSEIKIDKDKPEIKTVEDKKTYYKNSLSVSVTDENLSRVTLNGGELTITDNKATVEVVSTDEKVKYTLKAEDLAGNVSTVMFYLAPSWRKDGTVPGGKSITLYKDTKYTLGSGTWKVSGDATDYVGGNDFYVSGDGQYTLQSAQ